MTNEKSKKWYAVYTKSRAEKKVYQLLCEKEIDTYLPLKKQMRQWSDRKKLVETPLFSCYVFVNIVLYKQKYHVLDTEGVVKFVSFSGKIDAVQEKEIEIIKLLIDSNTPVEISAEHFKPGEKVQVIMGDLKGLEGEIVKEKRTKVLFRITSVNQNILVEIPPYFIEKMK